MNNFHIRRSVIFLLQSIGAGLALAFVLLYYFPEFLSGDGSQRIDAPANATPKYHSIGPSSYYQAVQASAPAVVNVYATKVVKRRTHPLLQDPIFRRFFGDQGRGQQRNSNLGSGVIIDPKGYVITNAHVIKDTDEILVTLADGRQTEAKVAGMDTETDLAVLMIELDELPSIPIGNSSNLKVGDVVLAIGNPYDFGQTVTQGIVSAIGRKRLGITTFEDFIQTDADINPGNSGGALVNVNGQIVGINTAIISNTGGSQGLGFAIPINLAIDVLQALITKGQVIRGWLGIEAQVVPRDLTDATGKQQIGVLVAGVLQGGPAEQAGIRPGDILTEINNHPLHDPLQAIQLISQFQPGTKISITLVRGWKQLYLDATVSQRPSFSK